MSISRLYATEADADAAVRDLEEAGFWTTGITVLRPGAGAMTAAELSARGVTEDRAEHYATRVAAGAAVVIVDPPFGWAVRATQILARPRTGDAEAVEVSDTATVSWDEAAPLSDALGLRVLSGNAAPLSSLLGIPTLSRNATPLSSAIGFKTLSGNATPLSSALGLKVLSKNAAPLSSAVGAPTLTKEQ
jgi:hypothetical protein